MEVGRTRKAVETRAHGSCFHHCFEFSQSFTSVTITLWKLGKKFQVLYNKHSENFRCLHRVTVISFQPISARIVSCLLYKKMVTSGRLEVFTYGSYTVFPHLFRILLNFQECYYNLWKHKINARKSTNQRACSIMFIL